MQPPKPRERFTSSQQNQPLGATSHMRHRFLSLDRFVDRHVIKDNRCSNGEPDRQS